MAVLQPDPGYDYRCQRCGHQWRARKPVTPDTPKPTWCAKCRSASWQKPLTSKDQELRSKKASTKARRNRARQKRSQQQTQRRSAKVVETPAPPQPVAPEISSILPPPPMLRQDYRGPAEPAQPENLIRNKS